MRRGIDPLAGSKRGRKSSKYTQLIFFDQPDGEPGLQESRYMATQLWRDPALNPHESLTYAVCMKTGNVLVSFPWQIGFTGLSNLVTHSSAEKCLTKQI